MNGKRLSFSERIQVLIRGQLGVVHETEDTIAIGRNFSSTDRDRQDYDRTKVLEDSLDAWRLNPLARRIVGLTTQYVVGGGISITCKHERTQKFIEEFSDNRLNHMKTRLYEMNDELTRTGNLFVLITTDAAGMSYIREVPADMIEEIRHKDNDVEQPTYFVLKQDVSDKANEVGYKAYDELSDDGRSPVMLHYTINRAVGTQWGESDLAPVLKWLSRYTGWLEDRARLNRYRNSFLFVVKGNYISEAERKKRQDNLQTNPPSPGSVLVTDQSEEWDVISPKLEAYEAGEDGLSLKKMIASGCGLPMHFLAEPESATRTTAEAAGGPTYRHFEQRQKYFLWIVQDLLNVVVDRRYKRDRKVSKNAEIIVRGADISARDNVALSMSASNITNMLNTLRDRNLIDNEEFLRLAYRFAGEPVDAADMISKAQKEGWQPVLSAESKPVVDNPVVTVDDEGETKSKRGME